VILRHAESERGASYIEFLIVAPILLLICGASVEFSRLIRHRQVADVISKEAAMQAYRQCDKTVVKQGQNGADPTVNIDETRAEVIACLNRIKQTSEGIFRTLGIQGSVSLSLYRFDAANLVPTANCSLNNPELFQTPLPAGFRSSFGVGTVGAAANWGCNTGKVMVVESAFNYRSIVGFRVFGIGNSFNMDFLDIDDALFFRETTIL